MTTRTLDLDWLWLNPGKAFAEKGCRITLDDGIVTSFERTSDSFASGIAALPPLVNCHDHGRGFKTVGYGASDGPLETWIPALSLSPTADPYLVAAVAFGRMARSGIAAIIHFNVPQGGDPFEEASAVSRAAKDVGIHVAYAVPIVDQNIDVYGNAASICGQHTAADLITLKSLAGEPASATEQVNLVEALSAQFGSDTFHVQFGPAGPQWCSNEALRLVAERSSATGLRVQMHLLETKVQREWADAAYPAGIMTALDAMGLLSPRLSVSHGVWLTRSECELLASREVTVVVNASSNLRLRSGTASLRNFADADLQFAVGLVGLALDDDDDMLREMRLLSSLNLPL